MLSRGFQYPWWQVARDVSAVLAAGAVSHSLWIGGAYCALVGVVACLGRTYEVSQ